MNLLPPKRLNLNICQQPMYQQYYCCNRFPNIKGKAKSKIFIVIGPLVRFLCTSTILPNHNKTYFHYSIKFKICKFPIKLSKAQSANLDCALVIYYIMLWGYCHEHRVVGSVITIAMASTLMYSRVIFIFTAHLL